MRIGIGCPWLMSVCSKSVSVVSASGGIINIIFLARSEHICVATFSSLQRLSVAEDGRTDLCRAELSPA